MNSSLSRSPTADARFSAVENRGSSQLRNIDEARYAQPSRETFGYSPGPHRPYQGDNAARQIQFPDRSNDNAPTQRYRFEHPQAQSTAVRDRSPWKQGYRSNLGRSAWPSTTRNTSFGNSTKVFKTEPFEPGARPTAHYHEWRKWLEVFEVALERAGCCDQRTMSLELMLQIGHKMKGLITTKGFLRRADDSDPNFPFYDHLVRSLTGYFRNFADINIDVADFNSMKQNEKESMVNFHMRLTEASERVGGVSTAMLTGRLLDGMRDRALSEQAYDFGFSEDKIIEVASKREAAQQSRRIESSYTVGRSVTVAAISPGTSQTHTSQRGWDKSSGSSRERECGNCGHTHGDRKCPASDERCRNCNRRGHYKRCCRQMGKRVYSNEGGTKDEAKVDKIFD